MRRKIHVGGIVLGRSPQCDVVLTAPASSRSQALVYLAHDGPRLVVLGKGATTVNGDPVEREQRLSAGDRLVVPGSELCLVQVDEAPPGPSARWGWVLKSSDGSMFGMAHSPFTIGGGALVDLRVAEWPERAARFHSVGGALSLEACVDLVLDGTPVEAGQVESVGPGATIELGGHTVGVVAGGDVGDMTTASGQAGPDEPALPSQVLLEFLPRGGRLNLTMEGTTITAYLPEKRCDLVAVLLSPPAPYHAGELVPDELVLPRVWRRRDCSRTDLNVLLHRLRRDLLRAGVNGCRVVLRAPGGGATRFALADEATVELD